MNFVHSANTTTVLTQPHSTINYLLVLALNREFCGCPPLCQSTVPIQHKPRVGLASFLHNSCDTHAINNLLSFYTAKPQQQLLIVFCHSKGYLRGTHLVYSFHYTLYLLYTLCDTHAINHLPGTVFLHSPAPISITTWVLTLTWVLE